MAAPVQPIRQQFQSVGRGLLPAMKEMALVFLALAALSAAIALTRPWEGRSMLSSGKGFVIASGAGLGAGFLLGAVPVLGGGRQSFCQKFTESNRGLGDGMKLIVSLSVMTAVGLVMGYAPAVAGGLLWGFVGNHLWHKARQSGTPVAGVPAAPGGLGHLPGMPPGGGHVLGGAV